MKVISGAINDLEWDADSSRIIACGDGKDRYGHCFTFDSGNTVGEVCELKIYWWLNLIL